MSQNEVKFGNRVCLYYTSKVNSCKDRGIEFNLSLLSVINIMKSKRCFFTKLPLTEKNMSIDRIDNRLGYVKGNVVACHKVFNSFKSMIEQPNNELTWKNSLEGIKKAKDLLEGQGKELG